MFDVVILVDLIDDVINNIKSSMNRLFQLQSELISGGGLDAHELKSILFGKHYKFREDAWKMVSTNKVFNDHYHLNDYTLD